MNYERLIVNFVKLDLNDVVFCCAIVLCNVYIVGSYLCNSQLWPKSSNEKPKPFLSKIVIFFIKITLKVLQTLYYLYRYLNACHRISIIVLKFPFDPKLFCWILFQNWCSYCIIIKLTFNHWTINSRILTCIWLRYTKKCW